MTTALWHDLPLFAGHTSGLPYQRHSRTSIMAAGKARGMAHSIRERVYDAIAAAPDGMTDIELQDALGLDGSTQRPRRIELLGEGRIRALGVRKQANGRAAMVWVVR